MFVGLLIVLVGFGPLALVLGVISLVDDTEFKEILTKLVVILWMVILWGQSFYTVDNVFLWIVLGGFIGAMEIVNSYVLCIKEIC